MEDDPRDPKILERQPEAEQSKGTLSLEHLLASQLTDNSEGHDWEHCKMLMQNQASILIGWGAEPCEDRLPFFLSLPPVLLLESWEPLYPVRRDHGDKTPLLKKSHSISAMLHLLQVFANGGLFNKAGPGLLNPPLPNILPTPDLAVIFIFPTEFINF